MKEALLTYAVWIVVVTSILAFLAVYFWLRAKPEDAALALGTPKAEMDPLAERCADVMEQLTRAVPYNMDATVRASNITIGDQIIEGALDLTRRIQPMVVHAQACRAGTTYEAHTHARNAEFLANQAEALYRKSARLLIVQARLTLDKLEATLDTIEPKTEKQEVRNGC